MDNNNWRPVQAENIDSSEWRTQLQPDSRQRIVNKIMETLKRHLPFSGQEGLQELRKIAVRFEEKIYTAATSQSDYLRKISLKMLTMESKSQNTMANTLQPIAGGINKNPSDPGAPQSMQSQLHNPGQSLPMQMSANQPQARQQLLPQNIQNNIASNGMQNSATLPSTGLTSVTRLNQNSMPNVVGQNNMSSMSQTSVGNTMGQGVPSNMFSNTQRQMPQGRQQPQGGIPQQQQQQQQPQLSPQLLYEQLLKQKFQQGGIPQSLVQQQQQQQQQQNLLQKNQMQLSQQPTMQTSSGGIHSGIQQNQQPSLQNTTQPVLQQHPQSALRQQQQPSSQQAPQSMLQQQSQMPQQQTQMLASQPQQQQIMGQTNSSNMQQSHLMGSQNNVPDMLQQQQQQQQQRLLGMQQNNLQNLQQQQLVMNQQQLGQQSNVSGLQQQQQQLLGSQSANSSVQTSQHSAHMTQQSKGVPGQQQTQQNGVSLLPNQGQQPSQPQMMQQIQSQPAKLQQQMGLQQQQPNTLQREMQQQRLQASGALLQPQNVIDQQKQQMFQSQRALPEVSSNSLDSTAQTGHPNVGDGQEETYQKIKSMRDMYLPEITDMCQKITLKLQQHDSLPQQVKSEQLDKLRYFKAMMERMILFLQVSKNNVTPAVKEKIPSYEKQIIQILTSQRPRKPGGPMQQGQIPPHMQQQHSMQQSQQQQSQISQVQPLENQMNPPMQSMNLQNSVAAMQQNNVNVSSLQQNSMSSLSGVGPTGQQHNNMMNSLQPGGPGSNLDTSSLQQVGVGSAQQNAASMSNSLSSMQPNMNTLQSNPNMLQHQHLKQQQEQQIMQSQQMKHQFQQQRQMHQQIMQKQQLLQQQQQLHQQTKQQQQQQQQQATSQLQANQMQQLHQLNDVNDMKMRQNMGVKPGVFQQHQRPGYHQQVKSGSSFPISSPQLLQAVSPQIGQHSSPQIDQQNIPPSIKQMGTPSANSPFIVQSPSTPLAPSPMPGDSEKINLGVSSLSNAATNVHQQPGGGLAVAQAQSLAIGTPGISASPLLEITSLDANYANASMVVSGKSSVEQPLDRLLKAVKNMSSKALSAAVSDIASVVSMNDRIAGSAPGNGSRAAVGEDLVAMTKCRSQARNFITQDGTTGTRKMRRYTSAMPLTVVSSAGSMNDTFKHLTGSETSDLESTATSNVKRHRLEANHSLLEEIREINQRLIDTVVDISDEDVDPSAAAAVAEGGEGTIVRCSFSAVALSPTLKSQYASAQMSPIQPLRLLVPTNYPNCSPILLDKFPVELSKEYEDLSVKAKSRFSISLRSLSQPMSLGEIARTWDVCARAVISDYAQQSGGGSFSSRYGTWEDCLSTA